MRYLFEKLKAGMGLLSHGVKRSHIQVTRWSCALAVLLGAGAVVGAESWQPAKGPLMTRWAAEVNPTNALPEYPRPQLVRQDWLNLNGLWNYAIAPATNPPPSIVTLSPSPAGQSEEEAGRGRGSNLSFDGKILVPFPIESALSGVMKPLDEKSVLWYQRKVAVPSAWRGRRVRLHFEAVDWQTRVLVNGKEVGQHRGGYDRFGFDITDQLLWNGDEEIVVAVTDPTEGDQPRGKQSRKPEGIFYTPTSGIWQTVWLEPTPVVCMDRLKLIPDVDGQALRLQSSVNSFAENLRVEAIAFAGGREVGRVVGPANAELSLVVTNLRVWTPDDPFLYDLRVTLWRVDGSGLMVDGGKQLATAINQPPSTLNLLDTVSSYFGMRKVALQKDAQGVTRIALNGKFVFQIGTLDQGFWPDGIYTAPTDEALRSDIEFLKKSGFNLTRKHVKVEPDRWYYWCDKLGLLVWQDMPSGNNASLESRRDFEAELHHMVVGLENHPSIIVWVLFNEGWGQYDTERLTQRLKALDPSRLINNASGWTDMRVGDLIDAHSYPGPDCPTPESRRAAVLGEFGGLGLRVEEHSWSSNWWGYLKLANSGELGGRYTRAFKQVWALQNFRGLSAAVYTQTTDVETECNGLLTYDRAVVKIDAEVMRAANRGEFPGPPMKVVLPDAMLGRSKWKYTTEPPGDDWFHPDFDASQWQEGFGGFGGENTPGSYPNTVWKTPDIWLRQQFTLRADELAGLKLRVYHDEDATIYLNGVLAAKLPGFITDYDEVEISKEAAAALRAGSNIIAVHCHQTTGGQGIDVGILVPQGDQKSTDGKGE